jgi:cytochrome c-type biogenesis protein CcmF
MIWAYEELGWGGYWGWDPVENAGLLPWFTATAFLHSVMVQERRGMLRVWNVSLVITTFFLTLFGTFMTRSGIVQSVHSFGQDPVLTKLFTGFMVTMLIFSFGFVIYRMPLLQARNELDSWVSREAAFLYNNWILLFSAFFVLFATMFPTLSEAITGQRITVAAPFFNQWMVPIGLIMLLLTGIGPLLAWRRSTVDNLRTQFLVPTTCGLVLGGTVVALGVPFWSAGLCFTFSGFVVGTIAQEFWRGARVRQQTSGTDMFTALVGLVGRNKRRYGGYLVHVGIVLMFLGFAGSDMKKHETLVMKPGQVAHVGGYDIRHDRIRVTDDGRKQMVSAELTIFKDGGELTKMYPARWFFRKHEDQPTTEVAIRRTLAEDLYIVMPQFEAGQQSANIEVTVTPLVNWLWLGFGVLALGTLIAVLPETAFAFAAARVPEGVKAATASMILLAVVAPAAVQAQDGGVVAKSPQQRQLEQKIICMCGSSGCVHSTLENCPMRPVCHGHTAQTGEIQSLLNDGKGVDQVLAAFVEKYGEAVLAVPRNTGFNALAWLLPYALGALGLVMILVTARRWSRPVAAVAGGGGSPIDPSLDARLDDELRNLD